VHRDAAGFGVAAPAGWSYARIGRTVCFRDPAGPAALSVDLVRPPTADPVLACRRQAQRLISAGALPGYAELRVAAVPYLPRAADWEYRHDGPGGVRMHAGVRWLATGGRAYAIGWTTPELDWAGSQARLGVILSSFTPIA
jgi:hypothetical protein